MSYRIQGLDPAPFRHLIGLSDEALAGFGAQRCTSKDELGFPDRVELRNLAPGETAILLNYEHQPAETPYRSRHAIFVREGAQEAAELVDAIPEGLLGRMLSLRAFDEAGNLVDADLAEGDAIEGVIDRFFADPGIAYLHAHYAKHGCYAARIERA